MALPWTINISPTTGGAAQFHPAQLTIAVNDQVHWANLDTRNAHWPGLVFNGQLNTTFFMENQIAPGSPSDNWTPSGPGTYAYECSLHPQERGTIVVS
jgi:plastocyanin